MLNILLEDVIQGHPVTEQRLKEVLGHTPLQVIPCKCFMHLQKCITHWVLSVDGILGPMNGYMWPKVNVML